MLHGKLLLIIDDIRALALNRLSLLKLVSKHDLCQVI